MAICILTPTAAADLVVINVHSYDTDATTRDNMASLIEATITDASRAEVFAVGDWYFLEVDTSCLTSTGRGDTRQNQVDRPPAHKPIPPWVTKHPAFRREASQRLDRIPFDTITTTDALRRTRQAIRDLAAALRSADLSRTPKHPRWRPANGGSNGSHFAFAANSHDGLRCEDSCAHTTMPPTSPTPTSCTRR